MTVTALLVFLLWLYCLFDCARAPGFTPSGKILWLLAVFFLPLVGSLCWLAFGREA